MHINKKVGALVGAAVLMVSAACSQDLNVTNPDNPDIKRALATPGDVKTLAISAVNSWYLTSNDVDPYMMLGVTADAYTANFGNFGMRFNNLEPRIAYANISSNADAEVARNPWDNNYASLGEANDVLRAFASGVKLSTDAETDQYKTLAMFVQAASLTNLALLYDKAFIVDETFIPGTSTPPELKPYTEVAAAAQAKWDAVIAASAGKTYEYGDVVLPMSGLKFSATTLNRIANTMAALLLTYTPRSSAEVPSVNWAKVAAYADKGIGTGSAGAPFDFSVVGDNNNWYSYNAYYGDENSWVRTDMKLIHKMDPHVPARYTGASDLVAPDTVNGDKRLKTDFTYTGAVIGDPSRGIWMQSPYYHSRYKFYARTSNPHATGAVPYILAAESDLAKAEALVQTNGDLALAATLINNTHVTRGNRTPLTATSTKQEFLDAIAYEREIETMSTNGFTFFQLRHVDDLQDGTVRHLPIPAKELETLSLPNYTFGGVGNPVKDVFASGASLNMGLSSAAADKQLELPNGQLMTLRVGLRPRIVSPLAR